MARFFSTNTKLAALKRQGRRCASCGAHITAIGEAGRGNHRYGERSDAHHAIPFKIGGPDKTENCIILCGACHYSAHQGGRWSDVSIYRDISWPPTAGDIRKITRVYPHYKRR